MQEQALARAAHDLAAAAGDARQWVADVQANAPRVASEALSLIETARRIESVAGKLERAATRRMCIGVFGPSQSGKSYLVSSLCKPPPEAAEGPSVSREGIFREMKMRRNYEKPSERRARERAEAVRRHRKLMRKRMDREGY